MVIQWHLMGFNGIYDDVPSGKHTKNYGKIHHFQWVNPLFLWQFSIAMLVYQRVPIENNDFHGCVTLLTAPPCPPFLRSRFH